MCMLYTPHEQFSYYDCVNDAWHSSCEYINVLHMRIYVKRSCAMHVASCGAWHWAGSSYIRDSNPEQSMPCRLIKLQPRKIINTKMLAIYTKLMMTNYGYTYLQCQTGSTCYLWVNYN